MAKRENLLPFAPIGVIIGDASGKRVSKEARVSAERILDELAEKIVKKASLLAESSGRKTVRGKDINLAFLQMKGDF